MFGPQCLLYVASEVDWSRDSDSEVETDAGAGFRLASYFHIGFCCAGHIYDNSALMEADLSVMRVFCVNYGSAGLFPP